MNKSETITRPDGTKYVQCTRVELTGLWSEDQERMARAVAEFGSSS